MRHRIFRWRLTRNLHSGAAQSQSSLMSTHIETVLEYRTEIRSRWTIRAVSKARTQPDRRDSWAFELGHLRSSFSGSDFQDIRKIQGIRSLAEGEWIDLDIDLNSPHREDGWKWNSNFQVSARIDRNTNVWYAAMRILFRSMIHTRQRREPFFALVSIAAKGLLNGE